MAYLPGWNRERLATADPADVQAARLLAYAQAVRPIVERDLKGALEELGRAELKGAAYERAMKQARARARENLQQAMKQQAEVRAILELDPQPDERAPD